MQAEYTDADRDFDVMRALMAEWPDQFTKHFAKAFFGVESDYWRATVE